MNENQVTFNESTVTELPHANRVRHLNPLDRIHVDGQVPTVNLLRLDTQQQSVQAGDHQALDMVRVAVRERLLNRIAQARHIRITRPVPLRQGLQGVERIVVGIGGHVRPVDSPHILPPAQDLPDKTLNGGKRCATVVVRAFGGRDDFSRIE